MNTGEHDAAVHLGRPAELSRPGRNTRQFWSAISILIAAAIFAQAVFAGLMLSGFESGYAAHRVNAVALIALTLIAGLLSAVTLRRIAHGPRLGFILLALAGIVFLQTAVGRSSAEGANLMWAHIPLGVALVGFAMQAVTAARKLGGV